MKKFFLSFTLTAATALLALAPVAQARLTLAGGHPSLVTPGDTFSFDVAGFNSTSGVGYLITPAETATFGTPQTYVAAGINGQDITITSTETVGATNTTDTFVVSTPVNFLTTTTISGTTITALEFDLGNANSGSNTISLVLPINTYTASGSILYSGGTLAVTPVITLGTGNTSYSGFQSVNAGTSAISTFAIRQFTFSITYTNAIPEPSTYAFVGAGALALGLLTVRRNRRSKSA